MQVIWDIMRCWVQQHTVNIPDANSYQAKILSKEPQLQANFGGAKVAMSKSKAERKARFVQNPENWGPRPRHGRPMLPHEVQAASEAKDDTAAATVPSTEAAPVAVETRRGQEPAAHDAHAEGAPAKRQKNAATVSPA